MRPLTITLAALTVVAATSHAQTILRVDDDASPGGDGTSWASAYQFLQDALAQARTLPPGTNIEIWVAKGVYYPNEIAVDPTDKKSTFTLNVDGLYLYGGFDGTETLRSQRTTPIPEAVYPIASPEDWTILDGNLDHTIQADVTIPGVNQDGETQWTYANRGDNAYHVVYVSDYGVPQPVSTGIDGFIIRGGNAVHTGPTSDTSAGGGLYLNGSAIGEVTIRNCLFEANLTQGGQGAAISSTGNGNVGPDTSVTIEHCAFVGNHCASSAAVSLAFGSMRIANCVLNGNRSAGRAGAVELLAWSGSPEVVNCTFVGNHQEIVQTLRAPGLYFGTPGPGIAPVRVSNCIFQDNTPIDIPPLRGEVATDVDLSYSCFVPDPWIEINAVNCFFADAMFEDLRGPDGDRGTGDEDLRLQLSPAQPPASPCVDAGDNTALALPLDLAGRARIVDGDGDTTATIDMGAYEFSPGCPGCPGLRQWANPAGGDFHANTNWDIGTPQDLNPAVFALPVAATVTLGGADAASASLEVSGSSQTTLDLAGALYDIASAHPEEGWSIVVGRAAADDASLTLSNGGALAGDLVRIGRAANSTGRIEVTSLSSLWIDNDLIVGDFGLGELEINSGGFVLSPIATIGNLPGSSGLVTVRDPGSQWLISFFLFIDQGDLLIDDAEVVVGPGGALVLPGGSISGNGSLIGDVISIGTLAPSGNPSFGTLTIDGDYTQTDDIPGLGQSVGRMATTIGADPMAPTTPLASSLSVLGNADLAGALIINLEPDFTPASPDDLDTLQFLSATSFTPGSRFDVALLPNVGSSDFLSVVYTEGGARSNGARALATVSLTVNPLSGDVTLDPSESADSNQPGVPTGATLADLDMDGDDDLLIALPDANNPTTAPGSIVILYNADDGIPANGWEGFTQTLQVTTGIGVNPSAVAVAPMDDDTQPDIIVANRGTPGDAFLDTISVLLVSDPARDTFATSGTTSTVVGHEPADLIAADLDADGGIDIAVANAASHSVSVAWNSRLGTGLTWAEFDQLDEEDLPEDDECPLSIRPGDFDGGLPVAPFLATANTGNNTIGLIEVGPARALTVRDNVSVDDEPFELIVADLDLDGRDDVATVNRAGNSISIALNTSTTTLSLGASSDLPIDATSSLPRSITAGDLDDDADTDLAVLADDLVTIFRNDLTFENNDPAMPRLAFTTLAPQDLGPVPLFVRAADLDNDARDDIVTIAESTTAKSNRPAPVAGAASSRLATVAPRGTEPPPMPINTLVTPPPPLCPADIDGDNDTDVFDFNIFAPAFGTSLGDPGFTPACDLNDDNTVDVFDFNLFAPDFGCGS